MVAERAVRAPIQDCVNGCAARVQLQRVGEHEEQHNGDFADGRGRRRRIWGVFVSLGLREKASFSLVAQNGKRRRRKGKQVLLLEIEMENVKKKKT
jgi:hypothetical protein